MLLQLPQEVNSVWQSLQIALLLTSFGTKMAGLASVWWTAERIKQGFNYRLTGWVGAGKWPVWAVLPVLFGFRPVQTRQLFGLNRRVAPWEAGFAGLKGRAAPCQGANHPLEPDGVLDSIGNLPVATRQ